MNLVPLLPFIVLSVTICVLLIAIAFWRNFRASCTISCAGLLLTLIAIVWVERLAPVAVTPLLLIDGFALLVGGLIAASAFIISLLAFDYFEGRDGPQDEVYVLLLSATLGGMVLAASTHFGSFVLGLELLGVSLYAMISYPVKGRLPVEAALKYLILSGTSSAFILFGIALLFAITGLLGFQRLAAFNYAEADQLMLMVALGMILSGVMFKLSLVPFHMWTPDVYEGAPAPVTAFVATISKGAIFAVLLRFFSQTALFDYAAVTLGLSIIAILSMVAGNLLALKQDNVKRVLAYSSIAHMGYLMVAFIAASHAGGRSLAIEASTFFLIAYFVTTLGAFAVIGILSTDRDGADRDQIADYEGLFWRRPVLATVFSAMLLSLAGIPLTIGFIGKFYVFAAAAQAGLWILLAGVIAGSGIGLFYYLRIIFNMTRKMSEGASTPGVPAAGGWVLVTLTLTLVCLGVYPAPIMDLIVHMIGTLV